MLVVLFFACVCRLYNTCAYVCVHLCWGAEKIKVVFRKANQS